MTPNEKGIPNFEKLTKALNKKNSLIVPCVLWC